MLDEIKRIARQTGEAETPARFLFGTVTKLSPLTVFVDNRYYLTASEDLETTPLIALKELYGHRHTVPAHATRPAMDHSHGIDPWETKTAEALAAGDRVALLRNRGGQQYLILGRV